MKTTLTLRRIHRFSAILLGLYVLMHLFNHLAGLKSIQTHLDLMKMLRHVYRVPAVEIVLLLAVGVQIVTGIGAVIAGWKQREGIWAWVQAGSGAYLAFFLVIHVFAVLYGRTVLGLDTNFYYAAAGMYVPPYHWFFVPYYFLAVAALVTHLSSAMHWQLLESGWRRAAQILPIAAIGAGVLCAFLITALLDGYVHPVSIPQEYLDTYE